MRPRTALLVAALGGLVSGLAVFPRAWPCVALGLVPLGFALAPLEPPPEGRWRRWLEGGLRGLAYGAAAHALLHGFVLSALVSFTGSIAVGAIGLAAHLAVQGLGWAAAGVVTVRLARVGVPRWLAFGAGAFAGTLVPSVFPWTIAGLLTPMPALLQLADLVGEHGVTALVAIAMGLVAEGASIAIARRAEAKRAALVAIAGAGLIALLYVHGVLRMARVDAERDRAPRVRVALLQPDIEAHERWELMMTPVTLAKLSGLTRAAEAEGVDLTIWPEAAYPYPVASVAREDMPGAMAILQEGVRGPILTGLIMNAPDGSKHNSAVVCEDGKLSVPYHKMHLVWFGEMVPFGDVSPWMRKTFALGLGLSPGKHQAILPAARGRVQSAVLNCLEDILPQAGREAFDGQRPNLLVNVTNDAWFVGTAQGELHARVSVMRAIELRRDMVRAVNRGHTAWVDAAGRVRARYDAAAAGTLIAEPALLDTVPTAYARYGDVPFAAGIGAACAAIIARRRRRPS